MRTCVSFMLFSKYTEMDTAIHISFSEAAREICA